MPDQNTTHLDSHDDDIQPLHSSSHDPSPAPFPDLPPSMLPPPPSRWFERHRPTLFTLLLGLTAGILLTVSGPKVLQALFPASCPRTYIYPFDVGCPTDCKSHRARNVKGPFYRLAVFWPYGDLVKIRLNEAALTNTSFLGGAQSSALGATFLRVESQLKSEINRVGLSGKVLDHIQNLLHISLSYLCCLTKSETDVVKTATQEWIAEKKKTDDWPKEVTYGKVHCYHERRESVTVIWDLDENGQKKVMQFNQELKKVIEQNGVPVVVDRTKQMPFHSTVIGFRVSKDKSIRRYLKDICKAVQNVGYMKATGNIDFEPEIEPPQAQRKLSS